MAKWKVDKQSEGRLNVNKDLIKECPNVKTLHQNLGLFVIVDT